MIFQLKIQDRIWPAATKGYDICLNKQKDALAGDSRVRITGI